MMQKQVMSSYTVQRVDKGAVDLDWSGDRWGSVSAVTLENIMGAEPMFRPRTQAKVVYDDAALYVIFQVHDRYVRAVHTNWQETVCRDSCVELFFAPGEDVAAGYFNIEVNCGGTALLYHQVTPRGERVEVADEHLEAMEIVGTMPKVVEPEITEPTTWRIAYQVPFKMLKAYAPVVKPEAGVVWRGNFYKCGDQTSNPHYLTWAPVLNDTPNFHLPQFFGRLLFE